MHGALHKRLGFWLLAMAMWGLQLPAHAASSVMIWPVDPVIEEGQKAVAMWLENRGAENVSLQIRVFRWGQNGKEESFDEQDVVLASPPLAVIPAGQRQLVRLMYTGQPPDGTEQSYRVLVDELPEVDPAKDGEAGGNQSTTIGVKLQVRYSIPLFINGKGLITKVTRPNMQPNGKVELRWRTVREGNAHFLVIRNDGNMHARLTQVQWTGSGQPKVINAGLLGYVLAGAEMRWQLPEPPPPGYKPEAKINGAETPLSLPAQ